MSDDAEPQSPEPPPGSARSHQPPFTADDWRLGAWRAFLTAHAKITDELARDLLASAQMPLAWYDVLVQLAEAPEGRLRMADLAERVLLSRSGLSRLVDRLAKEGLVSREPYPGDARGMYTVLTPAGRDRLRAASPIHLAGVRDRWLNHFSDDELRQLSVLLERVTAPSVPAPAEPILTPTVG